VRPGGQERWQVPADVLLRRSPATEPVQRPPPCVRHRERPTLQRYRHRRDTEHDVERVRRLCIGEVAGYHGGDTGEHRVPGLGEGGKRQHGEQDQ